jgi:hypothetical protein
MLASLYSAGICLGMLFSIQAVLRLDLCAEFGTVGEYVSKAVCYALTFVFLAGFLVETRAPTGRRLNPVADESQSVDRRHPESHRSPVLCSS